MVLKPAALRLALGFPRIGWLKMLKTSLRNWIRRLPSAAIAKFFTIEKSKDFIPGPINTPLPSLPNVFAGGSAKALAFQKAPVVFGPLLGSPIRFGRELAPVLVGSPDIVAVTGRPV